MPTALRSIQLYIKYPVSHRIQKSIQSPAIQHDRPSFRERCPIQIGITARLQICLFITARLLRLGRLLLRFFLPAGNHTDKQNQRHQHQNRKQNQPGVLPEELHLLLLLATPGFARLWISVGLPILFRLRLHASSLPSCMESLYINFSEISTIFVRFLKECPVFPSFLVFSLHFTAPAFTFSGSFHHFRAKASAFEIVM